MRKCPNCKKALPVGARRCVYCRMLLSDENESAANDVNNNHQFGVGNDDFGAKKSPFDEPARRTEELAHNTMIGLGAISSDNNVDASLNFGQRTIAGMPGISFGGSKPAAGSYRMASRPYDSVSGSIETHRNSEPQRQNFVPQNAAYGEPVSSAPRDVVQGAVRSASVVPAVVNAAPAPTAPEPQDNLLAGLPGVAPMPSSLVDEEFVDLTSKIFGEDFASVDDDDDEDEDGLDFDFTAPAPAPAASSSSPAPQTQASEPASSSDGVQPAASEEKKVAAPASTKSHKKSSPLDGAVMGFAALSLVLAGVWCVMASSVINVLVYLALAAVINILLDILFFVLRKKLSSMLVAILLFLGCLVSIAAVMLSHKNPDLVALTVFCASLGSQAFAAICSFFKKA